MGTTFKSSRGHIQYPNAIAPPHVDTGAEIGNSWANRIYQDSQGQNLKFGDKVKVRGLSDTRTVVGLYWTGENPIELEGSDGETSWVEGSELKIVEHRDWNEIQRKYRRLYSGS